MKYLRYTDMPRWYGLCWDFETSTLRIKIHSFFIEQTQYKDSFYLFKIYNLFQDQSLFDVCETRIGQKTFGFNDSISLVVQEGDWFVYQIKFPAIQISSLSCKRCDGTGKRYFDEPDSDETCWYCGGIKKRKNL